MAGVVRIGNEGSMRSVTKSIYGTKVAAKGMEITGLAPCNYRL
jgi:hypothetical protein